MYQFYIDGTLLPVTPDQIQTKIKNQNKTVNLINDGEVSILKYPGLTEFEFDIMLPQQEYPFAVYEDGFHDATQYLNILESLKVEKRPFWFKVIRLQPGNDRLFDTEMLVSLEEYTIKENASDGMDLIVPVKLKQYRQYGTRRLLPDDPGQDNQSVSKDKKRISKKPVKSYTVKKGDNLWKICKKELGKGSLCWEVARKNKIKNPNLIYPGQIITLE